MNRLPESVKVAHKTGEEEGTSHDVGIVYAMNPFIVCFASNQTDVLEFEELIREITLNLYEINERES